MNLLFSVRYLLMNDVWLPNDARAEPIQCNYHLRRMFDNFPEGCRSFVLNIWKTKYNLTSEIYHQIVSARGQPNRSVNSFKSVFKNGHEVHHHVGHNWLQFLNPNDDMKAGDSFWFEVVVDKPVELPVNGNGFPIVNENGFPL